MIGTPNRGQEVPVQMRRTVKEFGDKVHGRSGITNNRYILGKGIDYRTTDQRRLRDLIALYHSDYPDASIAEKSLIRRICIIEQQLEMLEHKFALRSNGVASRLVV